MATRPEESYEVVVLGGGNAAGYFARAAAELGLTGVAIVGDEAVVSYERPALSKAYLAPSNPARLPGFHTCVGGGGERQEAAWYESKGIGFLTGARAEAVDVAGQELRLAGGGSLRFKTLVVATGARAVTLEDLALPGAGLPGVHTLRSAADADALLAGVAAAKAAASKEGGGAPAKVVVLGGGYIGAEVAAGLGAHDGVAVTVVVPEAHLLARVLPAEVAAVYERFYEAKGIKLLRGASATGLTAGADGRVASVQLADGASLEAALVVVGVGARPNAELFEGQLKREAPGRGGLIVDSRLRCLSAATGEPLEGVYAVGDVAAFPPAAAGGGAPARQEHVTHARQSAAYAAAAIAGKAAGARYEYQPYFYSRVFSLSWQVFGSAPVGAAVVPWGLPAALAAAAEGRAERFGAYWIDAAGRVAAVFLESAAPEEAAAAKAVARAAPEAPPAEELAEVGAGFLLAAAAKL